MKKKIFLLFVTSILFGCKSNPNNIDLEMKNNNEFIIYVASHFYDCVGVVPQKCLLIKFEDEDKWQLHYDGIQGFNFEEEYAYKLLIKKEILDPNNVLADASSVMYHLVKILDKKIFKKEDLNGNWKLKKINNTLIDDDKIVLHIDTNSLKFFGNDGCNSFFGNTTVISSNSIKFGPLMSTKIFCEEKIKIADLFTNTLQESQSYKKYGAFLEIKSKQNTLIFKR
tara:strand:+ start:5688 stop:6362 length:675 start_codon:yes stop_codon:yes gene_type:complete